jgi:hypothetical protein
MNNTKPIEVENVTHRKHGPYRCPKHRNNVVIYPGNIYPGTYFHIVTWLPGHANVVSKKLTFDFFQLRLS